MEKEKEEKTSVSCCNGLAIKILEIYFLLMKNRRTSLIYGLIMITTLAVQSMGSMFYKNIGFKSDNTFYSGIYSIIQIPRIYPIIEEHYSPTVYWVLQYLYLALILLYIIQLCYVGYSIRIKKFYVEFPIYFLRITSNLFLWVLVSPIIENFTSIYRCTNNHHIIVTSLECWKAVHIFYCFLFTLGSVLFIGIGGLVAILYNESQSNSPDSLARFDLNIELKIFFYRVFLSIFTVLIGDTDYAWIIAIVHIVGGLYFMIEYLRHFSFYHKVISYYYGVCITSYFWFSVNLGLVNVWSHYKYTGLTLLFGVAIIIPLVLNIRRKYIRFTLLNSKYTKIQSDYHLDFYIKQILNITNNQNKKEEDEILLLSFIMNHKNECTDQDCPLKLEENIYFPVTNSTLKYEGRKYNDRILILSVLKDIYKNYLKLYPFKCSLHLSYGNFLFHHFGNIHLAITELYLAEKMPMTLQQTFSIYRSKKFIEEYLESRYNKKAMGEEEKHSFRNLDVTVVIHFEHLNGKLIKAIEKSANGHLEFWRQLDNMVPNLNSLHKLGLNITDSNKEVDDIWKQLVRINPNHQKALKNYGHYLKDVRNDCERSTGLLERSNTNSKLMNDHMNDFDVMFADDTSIVVINARDKETQGKIMKTNIGVTNLFKYNQAELIGQDVTILMPSIIGKDHNYFMEKYFKTRKETVVDNEKELYAIQRSGSLICVLAIVKIVPSLKETIKYIALLRQQRKEDEFILTDEYGRIDSMSEKLMGEFELQYPFLKENEVYIQFLCPELLDRPSRDRRLSTTLDDMRKCKDVSFFMPKDFKAKIEEFHRNLLIKLSMKQDNSKSEKKEVVEEKVPKQIIKSLSPTNKKLTVPKSVMKIAKLIYGDDYMLQLTKSKNILRSVIDYSEAELKGQWIIEVEDLNLGEGKLRLKVFRILKQNNMQDIETDKGFSIKSRHLYDSLKSEIRKSKFQLSPTNMDKVEETKSFGTNKGSTIVFSKFVEMNPIIEGGEDEVTKNFSKTGGENSPNPNDASEIINNSRFESSPLLSENQTRERSAKDNKKDTYLKKPQETLTEQNKVIHNLMKPSETIENTEGKKNEEAKAKEEQNPSVEDDTRSVASATKLIRKQIRVLRNAVYEEYSPLSIRRLKYAVRVVMLILLIIGLVYFITAKNLYANLKWSVVNIHSSRQRIMSVTSIGFCTRILTLINEENNNGKPIIDLNIKNTEDYFLDGLHGVSIEDVDKMNYKDWAYYCIEESAKRAKEGQNSLSTNVSDFREEHYLKINPTSVEIKYNKEGKIADLFNFDCWSAVTSLVIHALRVKDLDIVNIVDNEPSVYFILHNSFDGILSAIWDSTEHVLLNVKDLSNTNLNIFLALMIVASCSLVFSLSFILYVTLKVDKNKEKILMLFLDIPGYNVKDQFNKCKTYFVTYRDSDKSDHGERGLYEEEEKEEGKEQKIKREETDELIEEDENKRVKENKKKFKEYKSNSLLTVIGFLVFGALLEGCFLVLYLRSRHFSLKTVHLIEEIGVTATRMFSSEYLFKVIHEYISTKRNKKIQGVDSQTYLLNKFDEYIEDQQMFIKQHSDNKKLNTKAYRIFFNKLIFVDLCDPSYLNKQDYEDCGNYPILKRGLHSATIAYWDIMRSIVDFFTLIPEEHLVDEAIRKILVYPRVYTNERMQNRYFNKVYKALITHLSIDVANEFTTENNVVLTFSVVFVVVICLIYLIVWRLFEEAMRNSLWVTKCMLGIIPINIVLEVNSIKDFLINSSKALIFNQ